MSPRTIRLVWAGRRQMLRTPILKRTGLRSATIPSVSSPNERAINNPIIRESIGKPKRLSTVLHPILYVSLDETIAHAHDAVGTDTDFVTVRHEDERLAFLFVQTAEQI